MKRQPRSYSREKRKEQVISQLRIWYENGYAKEATSYQLARALDLIPAQTFRDILNEMVDEGLLKVVERDQAGRYTTKFYLLADTSLITKKYGKRRIVVKYKGVERGQLELAL